MQNRYRNALLFASLATLAAVSSCSKPSASFEQSLFLKGEEVIPFSSREEDNKVCRASHGYSNGGMFLSRWSNERIRYEDGIGYLSVLDEGETNFGAEIRTYQGYLYGYFGARMKPFKHPGTVQSVFTYNGGRYIWDEIDIEFLGKDTTHVQFNYYSNGVGGHEHWFDLSFDASESFHDYGFKWEEDRITWYVDYKPVYAVEASLGQWGNFFINVWAGNSSAESWIGKYEKTDVPLETAYDYMCYAPLE